VGRMGRSDCCIEQVLFEPHSAIRCLSTITVRSRFKFFELLVSLSSCLKGMLGDLELSNTNARNEIYPTVL
jgi:hypothetical protein